MMPWDLEDWLTESGADVVERRSRGEQLLPQSEAIYRLWLLDTEARNGGLSQYFCNQGMDEWTRCVASASTVNLKTFATFAASVNDLVMSQPDAYAAVQAAGDAAENLWCEHQEGVIGELRARSQPQRST